jgi:cytosine/adenosine deaminase-related metal-dependent hydrolase
LTKSEVDVVAGQARGVVVCPGSNAYLRNGSPPVKYMRLAGVTIGVGTDSLASNSAMDLFAEARAVGRIAPMMKPRDLVGMMTLDGASVLGMDDRIGSLTPGKQADVAIVRCGPAATPEEALLAACPADVEAVISGGHWRVRAGRPVFPTEKIESAAADVTGKASRIVRKSG